MIFSGAKSSARCGIIFDGDDTLWCTECLYDAARSEAREVVTEAGIDGQEWEDLERKIDVARVHTHGFDQTRFPGSCVLAYQELCVRGGCKASATVAAKVERAAQAVFTSRPPVMPHAVEILASLRAEGIPLALVTKGDEQVQRRRVRQSRLGRFFREISVVALKSPQVLGETIKTLGCEPSVSWMVGNSIRSDIMPALEAGLQAIWVNAPVWEYEHVAEFSHERVISACTLKEIPRIVQGAHHRAALQRT
ncbi:MAG TPA: HAD family hydrolase [Chthoniobacteraceae bacterium]|jgi:putative hydrolase of the HAD superfamily|nr:HAD family hydrolase [Chthoniobacteraceae bacterium]